MVIFEPAPLHVRGTHGEGIGTYTIASGQLVVRVTNFGACIMSIEMSRSAGGSPEEGTNVLLGYPTVEGYLSNPNFMGATVGPWANRIAGATLAIDGAQYLVEANEGENNNHTSFEHGLHKRVWEAGVSGESAVTMVCRVAAGEFGLPGNIRFEATFSVEGGSLSVRYHATSDATTYINVTSHSYFNLAGAGTGVATNQELQVFASHFLPLRKGNIPTGELRPVEGTNFDFREAKPVDRDIDAPADEQFAIAGGYDHTFCLDGYTGDGLLAHACRACDPASGRTLDVYTTEPGLLLYTANYLDEPDAAGGPCGARSAYALECQHFPDTPHHANFPQAFYGPGHDYDSRIIFAFSNGDVR